MRAASEPKAGGSKTDGGRTAFSYAREILNPVFNQATTHAQDPALGSTRARAGSPALKQDHEPGPAGPMVARVVG